MFKVNNKDTRTTLDILETLGMLDHPPQKSWYQFPGNFRAYLLQKINFIIHFFHKILQRNSKLAKFG